MHDRIGVLGTFLCSCCYVFGGVTCVECAISTLHELNIIAQAVRWQCLSLALSTHLKKEQLCLVCSRLIRLSGGWKMLRQRLGALQYHFDLFGLFLPCPR
jgi:hypothetical protein